MKPVGERASVSFPAYNDELDGSETQPIRFFAIYSVILWVN